MSQHLKFLVSLALVAVVALAAGYALPRPGRRGGAMLDAVAAVQRRTPRFVISQQMPSANWVRGAPFTCAARQGSSRTWKT